MTVQTFTRPATQSGKESAQTRLARHGGLSEARQKLAELESGKASVQAGIDRHKASLNDADGLAKKILNGEPIELGDTFSGEAENAKLTGYATAIARQKQTIEQELRSASRDVCEQEAPAHKRQAAELAEAANELFSTFDAMEARVVELRNAGVLLDNRFPLYDGTRLRTIVLSLKPIVQQFENFAKQ